MAIDRSVHRGHSRITERRRSPGRAMVIAIALGVAAMTIGACEHQPPSNADTMPHGAGTTAAPPEARGAAGADDVRLALEPSAMVREQGHAWIVVLPPELVEESDNLDALDRSLLRLLEDDKLLGPPHSRHDVIRTTGRGAYSHWVNKIYFSTSDNTDPTKNGRVYELVVDEDVAPYGE